MKRSRVWLGLSAILLGVSVRAGAATQVGTALTYQGQLIDGAGTVTGDCDFEFTLYDVESGGSPVAGPLPVTEHVEDGLFTITVDFGTGKFPGDARWLEVKVCCPSGGCTLDDLSPRIELTASPYAFRAMEGAGPPLALEIDQSSGRVGIGTSSPSAALHVKGDEPESLELQVENASSATGPGRRAELHLRLGVADGFITQYGTDDERKLSLRTEDSPGPITFENNGLERMRIDSNGRVGIGTGSPTAMLHVMEPSNLASGKAIIIEGASDGVNPNVLLKEDGGATGNLLLDESNGNAMVLETNSAARLTIQQDGDVGIGTIDPQTRLHIRGGTDVALPGGGVLQLGSDTNNNLAFDAEEIQARNNGAASRLRLNALGGDLILGGFDGGTVGIGTGSPSGTLHVVGPAGDGSVVLPDSSVSAVEILNEAGAGSSSSVALNLSGGIETVGSRTIFAPGSGHVLAIASFTAVVEPEVGVEFNQDVSAKFSLHTTNTAAHGNQITETTFEVNAGDYLSLPVTIHGFFSVSGGPSTVYLLGEEVSGEWSAVFVRLTLVYLPTSY